MSGRTSGGRGRRPGNPDTRSAVVEAALGCFAESGYTKATVRGIAARAGVDPALVHHYFGTKRELFLAVTTLPVDPTPLLDALLDEGIDDLGPRLVRMLVTVWDGPDGTGLLAALRTMVADDERTAALREFVLTQILGRLLGRAEVPREEAQLRASFAASQILGLITARYLLRLPPLATLAPDHVTAVIGPTVQRYLTGPIGFESVSAAPGPADPAPA